MSTPGYNEQAVEDLIESAYEGSPYRSTGSWKPYAARLSARERQLLGYLAQHRRTGSVERIALRVRVNPNVVVGHRTVGEAVHELFVDTFDEAELRAVKDTYFLHERWLTHRPGRYRIRDSHFSPEHEELRPIAQGASGMGVWSRTRVSEAKTRFDPTADAGAAKGRMSFARGIAITAAISASIAAVGVVLFIAAVTSISPNPYTAVTLVLVGASLLATVVVAAGRRRSGARRT